MQTRAIAPWPGGFSPAFLFLSLMFWGQIRELLQLFAYFVPVPGTPRLPGPLQRPNFKSRGLVPGWRLEFRKFVEISKKNYLRFLVRESAHGGAGFSLVPRKGSLRPKERYYGVQNTSKTDQCLYVRRFETRQLFTKFRFILFDPP